VSLGGYWSRRPSGRLSFAGGRNLAELSAARPRSMRARIQSAQRELEIRDIGVNAQKCIARNKSHLAEILRRLSRLNEPRPSTNFRGSLGPGTRSYIVSYSPCYAPLKVHLKRSSCSSFRKRLVSFASAHRMPLAPLVDDGSDAWPLARITETASAPAIRGRRCCVVLTTGALSPAHRGHSMLLAAARTALEDRGWTVLGGYLSPSHDFYVGPKAAAHGAPHAHAVHRVALAELVAADHPWIAVAKWEARQEGRWPDFPVVAANCEQTLARHKARLGEVSVFYVCGVDHFRKCGLHLGLSGRSLSTTSTPPPTPPSRCTSLSRLAHTRPF